MAEPAHRRPPSPFQAAVLDPLRAFTNLEASGGIVLFAAAFLAFTLANSPWSSTFLGLWENPVRLSVGGHGFEASLRSVIDDGLMAVFFFVVGAEIKRELLEGELHSLRQAMLPAIAALGGMAVPGGVYLAFNHGTEGARGWAIPMATDIAFSIGCLTLLGKRVPRALVVFLTALAIFDDIGGIAVIAVFYGHGVSAVGLLWLVLVALAILAMGRLGVESAVLYTLGGIALWLAFHQSGVHPTLAGVLLGLLIPAVTRAEAVPPLQRFEKALHPWVVYGVMPLFALGNSGVSLAAMSLEALAGPVFLGTALGLFIGKQIGIFGFTRATVALGLAAVPGQAGWGKVYGVSVVAGIGFTVALFIANLAFAGAPLLLNEARLGVLVGSGVSGVVGFLVLRAMPLQAPATATA